MSYAARGGGVAAAALEGGGVRHRERALGCRTPPGWRPAGGRGSRMAAYDIGNGLLDVVRRHGGGVAGVRRSRVDEQHARTAPAAQAWPVPSSSSTNHGCEG